MVIITGAIADKYITHHSVEELVELAEDRESLIAASYDLIFGWHQLLQSLSYLDRHRLAAARAGDRPQPSARLPAAQPLRQPEGALELGIVNELVDDARARALEIAELRGPPPVGPRPRRLARAGGRDGELARQ